jgi:hypothetical protein
MNCIICCKNLKEVKSTVHCPQANDVVCMSHCFKCKWLNDETSWIHCTFREHKKNGRRT